MSASDPPHRFHFDDFELDTYAGELRKRGVRLRLQGQPLQVLAILLQRAGELVTRDELRNQLWRADTFVDFDHSLHNAVARLREVLGDASEAPHYIETLPRRGYRFIAHVEQATSQNKIPPTSSETRGQNRESIQAIAVLPLEDLSSQTGEEYFADSLTEALITTLAKIKALRVISRTSVMQYKQVRKSLPQISRELNVDAVIEGSILRSGERIRINAQLIHAATDHHLWAESYERDFRDILSLQAEVAREIASQIRVILTPEENQRLHQLRTVNPKAHELYLKARYFWNKRAEAEVQRAMSYFRRAIDEDPAYAEGYVGLGDCYNILGYYNALPPMEAYPKGKAAALKALELDSSLAEAHATLGVVKRDFDWDWAGAEKEFQTAIELNPGYVEAHHWKGTLLSLLGRDAEALQEKNAALELDPLSVVVRTDIARILYFARDYDQALQHFRAAVDMEPHFPSAHLWFANVHERKGDMESALSELRKGLELAPGSTYALARLGYGLAAAGDREQAEVTLGKLLSISDRYVSPYDIALVYVALQDRDQAFEWLMKAVGILLYIYRKNFFAIHYNEYCHQQVDRVCNGHPELILNWI